MFNPLDSFDYKKHNLVPHDTEPEIVLDYLKDFIDSTQSNVSFQQQSSIFLNDEKDNLKEFVEDMTLHYIYKRIFNDASIIYKEYKKEEEFIDKFLIEFDKKYIFNVLDPTKIEEFALKIFSIVQAPHRSDLKKWSKYMIDFAKESSEDICYICGKTTIAKDKKNNIFLNEYLNFKDNPNYNKISKEIFNLFGKFKIKKSENNKNKIINKIFEIFYKNNNFEYFKNEYKKAYKKFNENTMEIEHNFPKSWGGSKNNGNLYICCHRCNQDKKDITFYSEYSISRFFSNQTTMSEAAKSLRSKLGSEALLSIKMKQKFKCINEDCNNHFNSFKTFYIIKIDAKKGFYFSNLQIECKNCIKSKNIIKIDQIGEVEFFNEFCIKLNNEEIE